MTAVHLVRGPDRGDAVEGLASQVEAAGGARVGVPGVLDDLNRTATLARVPARAARWGFRWDDQDQSSERWWPQGVTTSGDVSVGGSHGGSVGPRHDRQVVCTSWYAKPVDGEARGSRVTFVDVSDPARLRYRHVLLVDVRLGEDGRVQMSPLTVHAGGLVWHGDHLFVAGTMRGVSVVRAEDVLRVPDGSDRNEWFGYRYVLPVRFHYEGRAEEGVERMRYSFLSLARDAATADGRLGGTRLVAGEYARGGSGGTTRLLELPFDPATSLLREGPDGIRPWARHRTGVEAMQGAVLVGGTWFLATSAGRFRPGSLHVGRPPRLRRHLWALPVGVEDLAHWPERDEIWSQSEYPGRRFVFAMDRARWV